jgi:hypothetical protein
MVDHQAIAHTAASLSYIKTKQKGNHRCSSLSCEVKKIKIVAPTLTPVASRILGSRAPRLAKRAPSSSHPAPHTLLMGRAPLVRWVTGAGTASLPSCLHARQGRRLGRTAPVAPGVASCRLSSTVAADSWLLQSLVLMNPLQFLLSTFFPGLLGFAWENRRYFNLKSLFPNLSMQLVLGDFPWSKASSSTLELMPKILFQFMNSSTRNR